MVIFLNILHLFRKRGILDTVYDGTPASAGTKGRLNVTILSLSLAVGQEELQ